MRTTNSMPSRNQLCFCCNEGDGGCVPAAFMHLTIRRSGKAGSGLFCGEVVHSDWILEQRIVARHDGNAALGHKIPLAVSFGFVTDCGSFRNVHIAIDNRLADSAMA